MLRWTSRTGNVQIGAILFALLILGWRSLGSNLLATCRSQSHQAQRLRASLQDLWLASSVFSAWSWI